MYIYMYIYIYIFIKTYTHIYIYIYICGYYSKFHTNNSIRKSQGTMQVYREALNRSGL